ncbi:macrophage migration inhibitory factor [Ceratobasidium sp. AG-Ba]|nr:macrophage migration inhibitory factor [Ceratobasidium sp. AG-Ba]QRW15318.1 macrophage migration inhibitory factor [Ceratobasidium sp. AG-Ba]
MPSIQISTNVKPRDEAHEKELVLELSKFCAQLLSKPETYISVEFTHVPTLTFAGTFDPAFLMTITSLDNINPEANAKYSQELFKFLNERLNIPGDRGYITFNDPGRTHLGHKATTFATIFASK